MRLFDGRRAAIRCATACQRPIAHRFASALFAVVLGVSFLPVAAFAGEDSLSSTESAQSPSAQAEESQQGNLPAQTASQNTQQTNNPADSQASADSQQSASSESGASEGTQASETANSQNSLAGSSDSSSATNGKEDSSSVTGKENQLSTFSGQDICISMTVGESQWLSDGSSFNSNDEWTEVSGGGSVVVLSHHYTNETKVTAKAAGEATLVHTWKEGSQSMSQTYIITVSLPPVNDAVTLEVEGVEETYDAQTHAPRVTASDSGGHEVLVEYSADRETWSTDIGVVSVRNVSDSKTIWVRASVPDCYEGYVEKSVEMKITPSEMTLMSATLVKEYDGEPLTNKANPIYGKGFIGIDEGAYYHFTGSQTEVGESPNSFEYELNERTKAENYTINVKFGTLKVTGPDTRPELVVRANSETYLYEGKELSLSGFEKLSFRIQGETYTVSGLEAYGSGIEPGEYPVEVTGTPVVTDSKGNDVTERFHVKTVNGILRIVDWNNSASATPSGPSDKLTGESDTSVASAHLVKASSAEASEIPASVSAKTGDNMEPYAIGLVSAAIAAGLTALLARKRRNTGN